MRTRATSHAFAAVLLALTLPILYGSAGDATSSGALPETPLSNVTFVAFDVETTGLKVRSDRVVEIGAVRFRNGRTLAETNWLINPGVPIPEAAVRIHGITTEMVSNCPPFSAVYSNFAAFVTGAVLMAHNARFDAGILSSEMRRHNLPAPGNTILDTLPLFRRWFPGFSRYALGDLAARLKVWHEAPHRAGSDARTLRAVFEAGVTNLPPTATLRDLVEAGRAVHFRK